MSHDPEMPWLPKDTGDEFDPLEHADVTVDKDTPMVVVPRGGGMEVGRSCYQLETEHSTLLVDAGLNQGTGGQFPDFRGLEKGQVDGVFLTHAHIDHCGALPVLENRGLLDDDATIVATRPTTQIAQTLLEDSLKIHRREAQKPGREQHFDEEDIERVYERFQPVDYESGRVCEYTHVSDIDPLRFTMGNAGHLLGSAWISFETNGYRVVFSGDVGGRSTHLPPMDPPPEADLLMIESTYGGKHSHTSMKDARTSVYKSVERALKNREPVLIPTFSVGRAQTLSLLFKERLHTMPSHIQDEVVLVIDGMAQDATNLYHTHIEDTTYFDESIPNRVKNAQDRQPFLPENALMPETDADRERILSNFNPETGENIPLIISPSGMLTGGHSPRYLAEFAARYESANVFLTGYQAKGTGGRKLQNVLKAEEESATLFLDTDPFGSDWPQNDRTVDWVQADDGMYTRATIPADWVTPVDGLSGHAAQHGLLSFARDVGPRAISLIHGPAYAQERFSNHLIDNLDDVETVTRSRMLTPIPVTRDIEVETPALTQKNAKDESYDSIADQFDHVYELLSALTADVAAARLENGLSEEDVRRIIREEIDNGE
ncbi:MBL fold metallo-hydrolase [Haloferax sp. Atlit-6N]|uniref:MBL fold metallo-hydrolase n=1 Tax=Haloferax sp. Atlit-6N TaxID=2077205 RepID=UPI0018F6889F|nr:MBL fold metallo-hydrolase [Haloferax sp. Atlit-6N]